MRKHRDEFSCINETKKHGGMVVLTIAVLAICISGALCARKLQMDQKYISLNGNPATQDSFFDSRMHFCIETGKQIFS